MGVRRLVSGAVVGATVTLLVGGVADAQTPYPVRHSLAEGVVASAPDPAAPPPGVNVPACQMTAAHPRPIVLVNGTFANMTDDWSGLGPTLANEGYCVYSAPIGGNPNHIVQTTGPVEDSAKEISLVVDDVLAQTGAAQVDLVGHSQGGLISEYYTKILNGAAKVHTLVGLSPSTHGTTLNGLGNLAMAFPGGREVLHAGCAACADQVVGSDVLAKVDDGPIAQPGIDYTIIETRNESVVTPAGSSFIDEPGVRNLWVQDYCSTDTVDHAGLPYDPTTQTLVENALDPADPRKVDC